MNQKEIEKMENLVLTRNRNVESKKDRISPQELWERYPMTPEAADTVNRGRESVDNIISGKDGRLLVAVGPCSIHSYDQAMKVGRKILEMQATVADTMCLVMRVYFEKPRTVTGWKGLIHDPYLDGSNDGERGLEMARKILIDLNEMGVPCCTEMLYQILPEYLINLLTWVFIGARTTESQVHREWASGISPVVGFKNNVVGNCDVAINAMNAAANPDSFPGHHPDGRQCDVKTTGNKLCHIVLRGGLMPNYSPKCVEAVSKRLKEKKLLDSIIIDCSHDNSGQKAKNQKFVWNDGIEQIVAGNTSIKGFMFEANIQGGNQSFEYMKTTREELNDKQSITDECIPINEFGALIRSGHEKLLTMKNREAA